jgi:hypothetical protein
MVIGVGGVGSWVALNFALSGVHRLDIVDNDTVEDTNLNRTIFRELDVGELKVHALGNIIFERRGGIVLNVFEKRIESCVLRDIPEVVVDCRDNSTPLPKKLTEKVRIIGGYDGKNITIHLNPTPESIWGDDEVTYQHTPSWLIPPQIIASIITGYILNYDPTANLLAEERIIHFNLNDYFDKLLGGDVIVSNAIVDAKKVS